MILAIVFHEISSWVESVLGSGTEDFPHVGIVLQAYEGGFLQSSNAFRAQRFVGYKVLAFFAERITAASTVVLVCIRDRLKTVFAFDFSAGDCRPYADLTGDTENDRIEADWRT
jgi:hypothetical protein